MGCSAGAGAGAFDFSVLIPCKDEIDFVDELLSSVFSQSAFDKYRGEVLIMDGRSTDGTRERLQALSQKNDQLQLVDNPKMYVPYALNLGIDQSRGRYVVIMGAHAKYPVDYIATLIDYMESNPDVDNVGVPIETVPTEASKVAASIAHMMAHVFGVGAAHFRLGVSDPADVDTVTFGCYRKELFKTLGTFDEELIRNQDDELNGRLKNRGGVIRLLPGPKITYYARGALSKLWATYYQYGLFKPLTVKKLGRPASIRQLVPSAFLIALAVCTLLAVSFQGWYVLPLVSMVILYLCLSVKATYDVKKRKYFPSVGVSLASMFPFVCASMLAMHLSYGAGYLKGAIFVLAGRNIVSVKESR